PLRARGPCLLRARARRLPGDRESRAAARAAHRRERRRLLGAQPGQGRDGRLLMHPWNQARFDALKRSLERLPHALLVHGPRGVGKLALAERISQLLLCEAAEPASRPCGACEGCRWYLGGNHPDFRRLEPEALTKEAGPAEGEEGGEVSEAPARKGKPSLDIRIEQVRALADFLNVTSHRRGLRVALIHPAEE